MPSNTTDHFIYSIKDLNVSVLLRGHRNGRGPVSFCSKLPSFISHTWFCHLVLSTVCVSSTKFLSQLSKALRLAQYVCIGRYVYAHVFHLSRTCHLPRPFWWQVFWGWHFGDSCWHMQTSAMVKGKQPALEKNGCCRSGLRDISMWGNLAVPCLYHILLFPMPWIHLFHHYLKPFEVFIIFIGCF